MGKGLCNVFTCFPFFFQRYHTRGIEDIAVSHNNKASYLNFHYNNYKICDKINVAPFCKSNYDHIAH